jgi:hypothetical protein
MAALATTTKSIPEKRKPNVDPAATAAAVTGSINIANITGRWDAKVALKGGIYILNDIMGITTASPIKSPAITIFFVAEVEFLFIFIIPFDLLYRKL